MCPKQPIRSIEILIEIEAFELCQEKTPKSYHIETKEKVLIGSVKTNGSIDGGNG